MKSLTKKMSRKTLLATVTLAKLEPVTMVKPWLRLKRQ